MLFLCHRIPYPPDKGEKIRAWNLVKHLAASHRLHLGCLIDDPADWQHVSRLQALCADFAAFGIDRRRQKLRALARFRPGRPLMLDYYGHAGLRRWTRETLARDTIDVAYICSAAMAPYVLEAGRMPKPAPRRILDMQDVDSEKWTEYGRKEGWPMRLVWAREGRTLLAYERKAALACERTLFVSEAECRRFGELAPETRPRLDWVENGVDLDRFSPQRVFDTPFPDSAPRLVFTGHMDYWPNADAAEWFAREVMPILRQRVSGQGTAGQRRPAPRFVVVGANPGPGVAALAKLPDVDVTGRVADVRPYVAHAAAVVAPLRIARGIQNKVLEGMALARPLIATPQAFEGVRAQAGQDVLVGDGADALARLVGEVLDGAHPGLGEAGRRAVERNYQWAATLRKLDRLLADRPCREPVPNEYTPRELTP
ncbi:TIGR03087 family PEP-CTERM/XrtA system glycosyltransferase [Limobrevibacterium gyesilva]|nr:TIGR03087 family PEP-CTERM/XrtA system glycosyltransferase [Limobrevibacterium gyesilva]